MAPRKVTSGSVARVVPTPLPSRELPTRTFHGIPIHDHNGYQSYSNGHIRILRWQRFPEDCLEEAMEVLGSLPNCFDDGIKDPATLNGLENLYAYDDTPVKKRRK